MAFNSRYLVLILIPCLLISPTIGKVLTTSSAYAGSYIFDSTTYSQIGAFSSSCIQEDTFILTTKSGFVVFDLASRNLLNSTGFNAGDNGSVRIKAFDTGTFTPTAPYYDPVWSRIIVADGESSNPKLAAYDFNTLNILNNQQHVTNPKLASALKGVFGVVADDTYLYYASSSGSSNIARYALRDWSADPVLLSLSAYSLSKSFARDNETNIIYLGTTDGKIISVQVNNYDFSNSPVVDLTVTTEAITTVQVDSLRGYLYAATAGLSSTSPSILYRISLANFSVVDQLVLDSRDFTVSISAISDTAKGGILYLATQQTPARIIQIDVSRFVRETGYFLPDASSQGSSSAAIDLKRNILWIGTIDPLTASPSAIAIQGADLCLGDCFGRGTCINRTCSDCGTADMNGVTLEWMQPWCEFLNCVDPSCSGNGQCHNATCLCDAEWTGVNCTIKQCPNNCTSSLQGTCLYDQNNQPVKCECKNDWQGEDCSTAFSPVTSAQPSDTTAPISKPTSSATMTTVLNYMILLSLVALLVLR